MNYEKWNPFIHLANGKVFELNKRNVYKIFKHSSRKVELKEKNKDFFWISFSSSSTFSQWIFRFQRLQSSS